MARKLREKQKEFYRTYHELGRTEEAAEIALGGVYSIKTWSKANRKKQLDKLLLSDEGKLYLESLEKTKKVRKNLEKTSDGLGKSLKKEESSKKDNAPKKKRGCPTKYEGKMAEQAGILCLKHGYTDQQLADFFFVTRATIHNWKKAHPDFFDTIKESKAVADQRVERSLYERAIGYTHPETKVFCNNGEIVTHDMEKHYAPDTAAAFIWLKNRKPDEWRDKPKEETEREQGGSKTYADVIAELRGEGAGTETD